MNFFSQIKNIQQLCTNLVSDYQMKMHKGGFTKNIFFGYFVVVKAECCQEPNTSINCEGYIGYSCLNHSL